MEMRIPSQVRVFHLIALQFVLLLVIGGLSRPKHSQDMTLYYEYSGKVIEGNLPYRDFALEYPPLALVPMLVPRLLVLGAPVSSDEYKSLFLLVNGLLSGLTALTLAQIALRWQQPRNPIPILAVYTLLVSITAPLLPWRYDQFPALLTSLALLAVIDQRPTLAGAWLGLGTVAKMYPVVLLALFGAYYLAAGRRRALAQLTLASVVITALTLSPFVAAAPGKWYAFLTFHRERGVQIESLPGAAVWLGGALGFVPATRENRYGAYEVAGPWVDALAPWLPLVLALSVASALLYCLYRFGTECATASVISLESLSAGLVAALLTFIVANRVFSPQHIIWFLPIAPLLAPRHLLLFGLITIATIIVYPFNYRRYLEGELPIVLVLNLRNVLVVALVLRLLLADLRAHRESQGIIH